MEGGSRRYKFHRIAGFAVISLVCAGVLCTPSAAEAARKPNILIIWGDDIGYWNISAYNQGMMGS